ncbi:UDP-glycosyltransferase UGT5 isoform X2 [Hyalella azteca]|uniref:UDP-glucuronosyltransferase n=1 Tax=Hyalella azteca TaxID=294128 RepID=A0A8B7N5I0_HYAAZ|nr:UDP-glycosyltransferase UGT5 isoform X2 [Hyalella azteca]
MKVNLILTVIVMMATQIQGYVQQVNLPPSEESYKILFMVPGNFPSHVKIILTVATALADRGHQISVIGGSLATQHPNITYLYNPDFSEAIKKYKYFDTAGDGWKHIEHTRNLIASAFESAYASEEFMDVYRRRKEFDLMVVDHLALIGLAPFLHESPFIIYCTTMLNPLQSANIGNIHSPAVLSSSVTDYRQPYSALDRLRNLFATLAFAVIWSIILRSKVDSEVISKRFPDVPSSYELEKNASLTLINTHFSLDGPIPLLPNQVMVAGMLLRPERPLPEKIDSFVRGNASTILFSTGTFIRLNTMPKKLKEMFFSVFSKLPYKIVMKYHAEPGEFTNVTNIHFLDWIPQSDILAHANTKLFISHCGVNGVQEAVYYGVPMICIPVQGDHHKMAEMVHHRGLGIRLEWKKFSEEILNQSIHEIITNTSYRDKVHEVSLMWRDQMESPLQRAVYWVEYVARFRGAPHLRSPAMDLSLIQIFYLDLLLVIHLFMYVTYRIVFRRPSFHFSSMYRNLKRFFGFSQEGARLKIE